VRICDLRVHGLLRHNTVPVDHRVQGGGGGVGAYWLRARGVGLAAIFFLEEKGLSVPGHVSIDNIR